MDVQLEIQGAEETGYILVMAPDGCFTADNWYRTKGEALEDARKMFGAPIDGWASEKGRLPGGVPTIRQQKPWWWPAATEAVEAQSRRRTAASE